MQAHLRIARPTDNLKALLPFYQDGLGFEIVGSFQDHDGFDGIMLGHSGWPYHLEFTQHHTHLVGRAPTQDHLLVFYLPEHEVWEKAVQQMRESGYEPLPSFNPYWDMRGKTFEDADGYRVVLQNGEWINKEAE